MDFYDLTLDEQIRCIEVMRQKDIEKVLDSTYNPIQIRLNRKAINMYYDGLIKELKQNSIKPNEVEKEELSKVA
ncbi:MAG: hypothetical protein IKN87_05625 [Bacilli bacterium]|nr:hypothetical protein [Bacilli bacterium]